MLRIMVRLSLFATTVGHFLSIAVNFSGLTYDIISFDVGWFNLHAFCIIVLFITVLSLVNILFRFFMFVYNLSRR